MATITTSESATTSPSRKRKSDHDAYGDSSHPSKKSFHDFDPSPTVPVKARPDVISTQDVSPILRQESTSADKSTLPTSPTSNPLSQTSQSSQMAGSPSTAPSSIVLDYEIDPVSASKYGRVKPYNEMAEQYVSVGNITSRSPSVASIDGIGRSSGRARKPTSKAQALADAGTKFYQDLKRTSDAGTVEHELAGNEDVAPELEEKIEFTEAKTAEETRHDVDESLMTSAEAPILVSIENPSPTPVRSSSRQRKPTAKAVAAETETSPRKRTASPLVSERPSKISKLGMNTPREPSKLRQSLSSVEDDTIDNAPTVEESSNTLTTETALEPVPFPVLREVTDPEPLGPLNQESNQDEPQLEDCDLSCLSPEIILLAFARYAANDAGSEDDDNQYDQTKVKSKKRTKHESPKMSKSLVSNIIKEFCTCAKKHENAMSIKNHKPGPQHSSSSSNLNNPAVPSSVNDASSTNRADKTSSTSIPRAARKSAKKAVDSIETPSIALIPSEASIDISGVKDSSFSSSVHVEDRVHDVQKDQTAHQYGTHTTAHGKSGKSRKSQSLVNSNKKSTEQPKAIKSDTQNTTASAKALPNSRAQLHESTSLIDTGPGQAKTKKKSLAADRPIDASSEETKTVNKNSRLDTNVSQPDQAPPAKKPSIKLIGPESKAASKPRRSLILGAAEPGEKSSKESSKKNTPKSNNTGKSSTPSSTRKSSTVHTPSSSQPENDTPRSLKITLKVRAVPV